jgi:hypothetical protein
MQVWVLLQYSCEPPLGELQGKNQPYASMLIAQLEWASCNTNAPCCCCLLSPPFLVPCLSWLVLTMESINTRLNQLQSHTCKLSSFLTIIPARIWSCISDDWQPKQIPLARRLWSPIRSHLPQNLRLAKKVADSISIMLSCHPKPPPNRNETLAHDIQKTYSESKTNRTNM